MWYNLHVQLVAKCLLPPGGCLVTGSPDGPFIDTLIDLDDPIEGGRLYLSRTAVETMGELMGMLSAPEAQRLKNETAALVARNEEVEAELADLSYIDALLRERFQPQEEPDGQ